MFLQLSHLCKVAADEQDRLVAALATKIAAEKAASASKSEDTGPTPLEKFADFYKERTGEDLHPEMRAKLSEPGMAEIVLKLADQNGGPRTPLGDAEDLPQPKTSSQLNAVARTPSAVAAWDHFGEFFTNRHP